jgi:A/G-specific adenine glycosylase
MESFRYKITTFYKKHKRDLPWRNTTNQYHIYVSEIMLQQTQVERVVPKYYRFIAEFPGFPALAAAPLPALFGVWQGLGYNRRCLLMKASAKIIVSRFGCRIPESIAALKELPGIGEATGRALIAFCFNRPVAFIETNIRQVFLHFFFRHKEEVSDSEILPLVEKTLDRKNPREWYYALMDYGAMLKKQVGNLGVKSSHYIKPSPFQGSMRQLRGMVLKTLLSHSSLSEDRLVSIIRKDPSMVKEALHTLEIEGFIEIRKSSYTLKS